jgi:hypothetical protein
MANERQIKREEKAKSGVLSRLGISPLRRVSKMKAALVTLAVAVLLALGVYSAEHGKPVSSFDDPVPCGKPGYPPCTP